MSDMNFICPTCKRPTHPTDNEIIEHLAKEIDRYVEVLIERTKELDRTRKALETLQEFITKLYLNGNITDEQLERYKKMLITALEQKDK